MAANKHPLDLFRSSKAGFDSATRDPRQRRRTMAGKVLVSTPREAQDSDETTAVIAETIDDRPEPVSEADDDEEIETEAEDGPSNALEAILAQRRALEASEAPAAPVDEKPPTRRVELETPPPLRPVGLDAPAVGKPPGSPAASTPPSVKSSSAAKAPAVSRPLTQKAQSDGLILPPGISSGTRSLSYLLLSAAGVLVVGLALWAMLGGDDAAAAGDGDNPSLQKSALANAGTDVALGSSSAPSEYTIQAVSYGSNLAAANAAADGLESLGFPEVNVTGVPDGDGGFTDVALIVGRAATKAELEPLLAQLRTTPLGKEQRPFHTAFIVGHPAAE